MGLQHWQAKALSKALLPTLPEETLGLTEALPPTLPVETLGLTEALPPSHSSRPS